MFGKIVLGACVVSYMFASVTRGYLLGVAEAKRVELEDGNGFELHVAKPKSDDSASTSDTPVSAAA